MRRNLTAVVAALAVAVSLAPAGFAGAGGTLTISPSTVPLGSTFTLAGCNYPAGSSISFEFTGPRKSGIDYFTADQPVPEDGCVSQDFSAWWGVAGAYQATSWYRDSKGSTHKASVVKFTVTS